MPDVNHDTYDHTGIPGIATTLVSALASASSGLTLTTSDQDVPGASITASPAGSETWVVLAIFNVKWTTLSAGNYAQLKMALDGSAQTAIGVFKGDAVGETCVAQVWRLAITAGSHTVKLVAKKTASGGVCELNVTNTQIALLRL
jgi:hypothetical protein